MTAFPPFSAPERRIYFVRHGQSSSNAGALSVPHAEVPLTELGQAQAAAVAPLLPARPALVLTSPYVRARQTAAPYCARCQLQMHDVDLLHEFDAFAFHLIEGMTGAQRRPVAAAFWDKADPLLRTACGAFAPFSRGLPCPTPPSGACRRQARGAGACRCRKKTSAPSWIRLACSAGIASSPALCAVNRTYHQRVSKKS